jgi:hypothetical protein
MFSFTVSMAHSLGSGAIHGQSVVWSKMNLGFSEKVFMENGL